MKNKVNKINLENLADHQLPLREHPRKWLFEDEKGQISPEYEDQIIVLDKAASVVVSQFYRSQRQLGDYVEMDKYYSFTSRHYIETLSKQEVKKLLYSFGIPFKRFVIWYDQPGESFLLTWKMLIHFSEDIFFGDDILLWDHTLNWHLIYEHNGTLFFGKNRIENANRRSDEIMELEAQMKSIMDAHARRR